MLARRTRRDALSLVLFTGLAWALAAPLSARAAERAPAVARTPLPGLPRVGPGRGSGKRQVEAAPQRAAARKEPASKLDAARSHQLGKPPKVPRATLPEDAVKGTTNERVRRSIAGGVTASDLELGQDDPELLALRQAERRLFPASLNASEAGWDAELPRAVLHAGPRLSASGLPLANDIFAPTHPTPAEAWPHGLNLPNLPVTLEQRTLDFVKFYRDAQRGRSIAETWARKCGRYVPAVQAELARAGLPVDLVWMSLIESGHNPTIRSPAGAAGLWQFIPESARFYGLTVDRWVDERLDPLRSTQAAAIYLSDLYQRFGTWELAMAAYNMGHYGLTRAIRKYNTNDFWRLSRLEAAIPWETALYVPKVLAIAIVMTNKRAFGLGDITPDPAMSFDTVYVPAGVPLASIAEQAGLAEDAIAALNPQYLISRTPPASAEDPAKLWAVHVPLGQGNAISRRLAEHQLTRDRHATYQVRVGDTPTGIAQRLRGVEQELLALNQLEAGEALPAGSALLVPASFQQPGRNGELAAREDSESVVVVPPLRFQYGDRERVFYRILPGDDLDSLAEAFRVSPEDLVIWNSLDARAKLHADMVLQVFVTRGADFPGVRYARERNTGKRLDAASPSFIAHFEAEQGRQRLQILAREGDTLHSIGRRYGLSAGMMERINHFSRTRRLGEGTPVVVYAKYGPVATEVLLSRAPDPLPPLAPPHPAALPVAPAD
jgi:peptidoglycan lytic transglycosylase D